MQVGFDAQYPPSLVWDYLTVPSLEARVLDLDTVARTDSLGGRVRPEAGFYCAHGDAHFYARILDWMPFDYRTFVQRAEPLGNLEYLQTRRLIPIENGTRFAAYLSKPENGATAEARGQLQWMSGLFANLTKVIEQDVVEKKVLLP